MSFETKIRIALMSFKDNIRKDFYLSKGVQLYETRVDKHTKEPIWVFNVADVNPLRKEWEKYYDSLMEQKGK